MMMKPQWAPVLIVVGGYLARRIVAMMNVTMLPRFPPMSVQRRPKRSMKRMQRNWATSAMMELMA